MTAMTAASVFCSLVLTPCAGLVEQPARTLFHREPPDNSKRVGIDYDYVFFSFLPALSVSEMYSPWPQGLMRNFSRTAPAIITFPFSQSSSSALAATRGSTRLTVFLLRLSVSAPDWARAFS